MASSISKLSLIFTLFLFSIYTQAQLSNPYYSDGDKVIFVGNSITNDGEYHAIISLYQATRFPHQHVKFYNCGVSGENAINVLRRYNVDLMRHQPNKAAVMLGMNDVGGPYYLESLKVNGVFPPDMIALQEQMRTNYISRMQLLMSQLKTSGCKVVIQSPTMYDETINLPNIPIRLMNNALTGFALLCKNWATENQLPFADYNTELNRISSLEKAVNPGFSFTPGDRVHPKTLGHFTMAYIYLKSLGMPSAVSTVELTVGNTTAVKSENASINNITLTANGGTFKCQEYALPMPVIGGSEQALTWSYFDYYKDLNNETLKINGLNPTQNYGLTIGTTNVSDFTGAQLATGINLAKYNTPQKAKAEEIRVLIYQKREIEWKIRKMRLLENFLSQSEMETMTMAQKMTAVATRSTALQADKDNYAIERPKEDTYNQQIADIENQIIAKQVTSEYTYTIGAPLAVNYDYNQTDLSQIKLFLNQPSTVAGKTNAEVLGITTISDPANWPNSGFANNATNLWVWDTTKPYKLLRIHLGLMGNIIQKAQLSGDLIFAPASLNLFSLNLSGCTNLKSFVLNGSSEGPYIASFDNCANMTKIDFSKKTSFFQNLTITNCTKLRDVLLNNDAFITNAGLSRIIISNNPLLSNITKLDVNVTSTRTDKTMFPDAYFRLTNNGLLFSKLPTISAYKSKYNTADTLALSTVKPFVVEQLFNYELNQHEVTKDTEIDFSTENSIRQSNSKPEFSSSYTWYQSKDNSMVLPTTLSNGKFKLNTSGFVENESYYLKISNNAFSAFGLSEIISAPFYLRNSTGLKTHKLYEPEIYPNPFKDFVKIKSESEISKVEVYNIMGCLVYSQKLDSKIINLSNLPVGSYIFKIYTNTDKEFNKHIIKQ